jgi:hypothetical protein
MCIKGATHDLSGNEIAQRKAMLVSFRGALLQYMNDVVGSVDEIATTIYEQDKVTLVSLEERHAGDHF